MRSFGTALFLLFIISCALSVSNLALGATGMTDQMVAEFVQKHGWGAGTHWNIRQQAYVFSIFDLDRGGAPTKLLLVGGVPVKLYNAGGDGPESAGARTP